jgi:hypothetical protein
MRRIRTERSRADVGHISWTSGEIGNESALIPVGTIAPYKYFRYWSGRRESNPRHTAWEAVVLPLNYARNQTWPPVGT